MRGISSLLAAALMLTACETDTTGTGQPGGPQTPAASIPSDVVDEAPLSTPAGPRSEELVGVWSVGIDKFALNADGTAQRWYRYYWDGRSAGNPCKLEGDTRGSWAGGDGNLAITMTEGKWQDCNGAKDFAPSTETFRYRIEFAEGIQKNVLWLTPASGDESGYNLECEAVADCDIIPDSI